MQKPKLLVIDDDRTLRHFVRRCFEDIEIEVIEAESASDGIEAVRQHQPDTVLLDIVLPRMSGLEVFQHLKSYDSKLPVIFITADDDAETAIEAMMLGGYDYVVKPLVVDQLRELVGRAIETRRMMQVPVEIPADDNTGSAERLVGRSPRMLDVYKAIGRAAPQDVTVLIRGESGTGKELVARAIYQHSPRRDGPFLAVNCAALPDTLLESELFGHEKGAFTGADRRRIGKFEQCSGGTLFLDEIGDMSPLVQSKVLRLLQEQKFERVGGNETIETDVRIIAATHRNLEKMTRESEFREDLYYRLNGFTISIPPLRERGEDIAMLVEHFLNRLSHELNRPRVEGVAPSAVAVLQNYRWPGNVRELQSVVRQALLNATGPVIVPEFLPSEVKGEQRSQPTPAPSVGAPQPVAEAPSPGVPPSDLAPFVEKGLAAESRDLYAETLERMERYLITRVLKETGGNQSKAAEILGITRGKVHNRIQAFGISMEQDVSIES
ncbi:sigma-54 dependent transcriptional regulator [Maioricimonas sp. JC845]|uniref:sigma-54-dependent transcriptional regulator n=1 Tax=Maioricimonas sp. JC845 TaxID=3232138 RepID=UPI003459D39D